MHPCGKLSRSKQSCQGLRESSLVSFVHDQMHQDIIDIQTNPLFLEIVVTTKTNGKSEVSLKRGKTR